MDGTQGTDTDGWGLQDLPVPAAAIAGWSRMCDDLADCDLETAAEAERELASVIRRKRPDGWAVRTDGGGAAASAAVRRCIGVRGGGVARPAL